MFRGGGMSACPAATSVALTLAESLKSVDCQTGEAVSTVFGRLFGPNGHLLTALTILLTIYVALFAVALLGGRTRLGISTLTPRMMTLGLVLTFATSWAAYQNIVWNLATGGPDEIAQVVTGTKGSATVDFADRLDGLFGAVADVADQASKPAPPTQTGITPPTPMVGGFTASTVLWLSALMLLLGSVGVMVTAKIALAALLAIGPVFIMLALFGGTRGLFEGWLKAVVMFALAPLFAVILGGGAIAALEPVAAALVQSGGEPSTRLAGTMFVGSAVFVALMIMGLKTAATIVSGWRLPGSRRSERERGGLGPSAHAAPLMTASPAATETSWGGGSGAAGDERIRGIVAAVPARAEPGVVAADVSTHRLQRLPSTSAASAPAPRAANGNDPRSGEVGRRFRVAPDSSAREKIS
ncbi:MAG: type IV secretion system protein [Verrucomicrobiaceae bacterium]|nr:type IV secretion system protein [Verrucomicrobiaceae bacterium]